MSDPTEFVLHWIRYEAVLTKLPNEERCLLCAFGNPYDEASCLQAPECHANFRDDDKTYYWRRKLEQ